MLSGTGQYTKSEIYQENTRSIKKDFFRFDRQCRHGSRENNDICSFLDNITGRKTKVFKNIDFYTVSAILAAISYFF